MEIYISYAVCYKFKFGIFCHAIAYECFSLGYQQIREHVIALCFKVT